MGLAFLYSHVFGCQQLQQQFLAFFTDIGSDRIGSSCCSSCCSSCSSGGAGGGAAAAAVSEEEEYFHRRFFFQPIQIERKKEKHPLFPEIVPMKVSLRFTFDIIIQVFFSRQFSSLRFSLPGGLPGPGGENESETPPVKTEPPAAAPKRGRRNSAGDEGAQIAKPKSKVARKKT